jgi:hypothetical protein
MITPSRDSVLVPALIFPFIDTTFVLFPKAGLFEIYFYQEEEWNLPGKLQSLQLLPPPLKCLILLYTLSTPVSPPPPLRLQESKRLKQTSTN